VKPSDSMLRLLLAGAAPEKYGRFAGLAAAKGEQRPKWLPPEPSSDEVKESILSRIEAIHRHRIEEEGYSEGPGGQLVPPGLRLVSEEELARLGWTPPEEDESWNEQEGGGGSDGGAGSDADRDEDA
jgi:hypothetical protein